MKTVDCHRSMSSNPIACAIFLRQNPDFSGLCRFWRSETLPPLLVDWTVLDYADTAEVIFSRRKSSSTPPLATRAEDHTAITMPEKAGTESIPTDSPKTRNAHHKMVDKQWFV
jgi:hypothetical protein